MTEKNWEPRIEWRSPESLIPYERNTKAHSLDQISQVAGLIARNGFYAPIVVDKAGVIIAGHCRCEAAISLRYDKVPVIVADHLTEDQVTAARIADNRSTESPWNLDMLKFELNTLDSHGVDLGDVGFPKLEIGDFLETGFMPDEAFNPRTVGTEFAEGNGGSAPAPANAAEAKQTATLADRFIVPPFSVLDARAGYWQDRKAKWLAMGIKSELGRGDAGSPGGSPRPACQLNENGKTMRGNGVGRPMNSMAFSGGPGGAAASMRKYQEQHVNGVLMKSDSGNDPAYYFKKQQVEKKLGRTLSTEEFQRDHYEGPDTYESGTSIFDPVICELAYRWFCPPGGTIVDPFAGGSVRGIVASKLGRQYVGIELREEQVAANRIQGTELCADFPPTWHHGDSRDIPTIVPGLETDMVFSCPPYADLEVYSDDPKDLSTLEYPEFREAYKDIIAKAAATLKQNRFACFVVGEVRNAKGQYYGFVTDTIQAFEAAGCRFYNEAILVTAVGSLAIRAGRSFEATRKLGKAHQNVLVFCKGDPKLATRDCGKVEISFPGGLTPEALAGAQEPASAPADPEPAATSDPDALTPVEDRGGFWVKRDDLLEIAGVRGGKVRSCWHLCNDGGTPAGLVTAGSISSPQVNIVAHIAKHLGIPSRLHIPKSNNIEAEVLQAQAIGGELVQHPAGYNNVIIARSREDAKTLAWREIPFGMECKTAIDQTQKQVANLPWDQIRRLVVVVGSGMSLAGILWGMAKGGIKTPVTGVVVGADPKKRLAKWAPPGWENMVKLLPAQSGYKETVDGRWQGIVLDPHYEAKCIPFLTPGDCLWIVGCRNSARC